MIHLFPCLPLFRDWEMTCMFEFMMNFSFLFAGYILLLDYIKLVFTYIWAWWVFQLYRSFFFLSKSCCAIFKDQWRTCFLTLFWSDVHFNPARYLILHLYYSAQSSWGKRILGCSKSTCGTTNYCCKIIFLWSVFSNQTTLNSQKGTYPIPAHWTTKAFWA